MRLAGARIRTVLGPPHSSGLDERLELKRDQELEQARRAGWPELDRADLVFRRYGIVEHAPSGDLYRVHRGELVDALYTAAAAYYRTEDGDVVFLELHARREES